MHRRPKAVPRESRPANVEFFLYPGSPLSTGSETSSTSSRESSTACSSLPSQSTARCAADVEAAGTGAPTGGGGESARCTIEEAPLIVPAFRCGSSGESGSVHGEEGVAPTLLSSGHRKQAGQEQQEGQDLFRGAEEGREQSTVDLHQTVTTATTMTTTTTTEYSSWSGCSVCLEPYGRGDRVCRMPCRHVFHAEVR